MPARASGVSGGDGDVSCCNDMTYMNGLDRGATLARPSDLGKAGTGEPQTAHGLRRR